MTWPLEDKCLRNETWQAMVTYGQGQTKNKDLHCKFFLHKVNIQKDVFPR